MVGGLAGQLGSQVSSCGRGVAGPLYHPAQPAGLVASQTGLSVGAGRPEQDGILLHYSTGTAGNSTTLPNLVLVKS